MDEYLLFYKQRLPLPKHWEECWDVFISAYNSSERVRLIYERVRARQKYWLILPEYGYAISEFPPSGEIYEEHADNEAQYIANFIGSLRSSFCGMRIVVDITGFINHYVPALFAQLQTSGIVECDVLYGEPVRYLQSERTRFSDEAVLEVRQVAGFEGLHTPDTSNHLLVVAVGYDVRLVGEVANYKEHARKIQLLGFPSLKLDMYQENLLRAANVAEAVGPEASRPQHFQYAPAYDPFVTASVLSTIVCEHRANYPRANVYLSPLSTKAQTLGFAVFYLRECRNTPISIIYPFCAAYTKETSEGLSGVWLYHLELSSLTQKLREL